MTLSMQDISIKSTRLLVAKILEFNPILLIQKNIINRIFLFAKLITKMFQFVFYLLKMIYYLTLLKKD